MEDLLIKNNISDWTPAVENELMRWSNNAKINKELHSGCHSYYKRHYQWLSIPVIVLSTIAGAANFIVNTLLTTEQDKTYANVGIGIVNLCVGVLSTLMNFFKLAEKEQLHKKAAEDYENLSTLIDAKLGLLHAERGDAREFYNLISKEYTRLKTNEVHIKKIVRRKFKKANKHMISRHEVEFPDSLSTIENLYRPTPKYKTNNGTIPLPAVTTTKVKRSLFGSTSDGAKPVQSSSIDLNKKDDNIGSKLQNIWNSIVNKSPTPSTSDDISSRSSTDISIPISSCSYSIESASPPNTPNESDISSNNASIYSDISIYPTTPQLQTRQLYTGRLPASQSSQQRPHFQRGKNTKIMSIPASPIPLSVIPTSIPSINTIANSITNPITTINKVDETRQVLQDITTTTAPSIPILDTVYDVAAQVKNIEPTTINDNILSGMSSNIQEQHVTDPTKWVNVTEPPINNQLQYDNISATNMHNIDDSSKYTSYINNTPVYINNPLI